MSHKELILDFKVIESLYVMKTNECQLATRIISEYKSSLLKINESVVPAIRRKHLEKILK